MLSRTVFVRRLKRLETGEYTSDPDGEIGEVLSKDVVLVPDDTSPTGHSFALMLTVEWENTKYPALDMVPANLLENVTHLFEEEVDDEAEEISSD